MMTYIAKIVSLENGDVMDLINTNDPEDRIMAAPDEFHDGELIPYDELELHDAMYIDEDGNYGRGTFAFKKLKL